MNVLCVIPARGGSKRIKDKNLCAIGKYSLVERAILQAKKSKLITRIIVSTDSDTIRNLAHKHEAEVIRRKPEMATDTAGLEPVIIDLLKTLKNGVYSYKPDYIVLLQPTTPFRRPEDIDAGINKIINTGSDSLLFCTKFSRFVWDASDMVPLNYHHEYRPRTQNMPLYLLENGNYITKPEVYYKYQNRLGGKMTYYIMDGMSEFEIDTEFDLAVCRGLQRELELEVA